MTASASNLFVRHFWTPALETWNDLKSGSHSFTRVDITGYLWNSLICSAPLIAGGASALAINRYAHKHWVKKLPAQSVFSFLFTAGSFVAGASISFFVVRLLAANHGTLSSFTADKALKLETLHVVALAAITPLATYFKIPLSLRFHSMTVFFGTAAVAGYLGERSLYVIGALSALRFAVNASFVQSSEPKPAPNWGLPIYRKTESF